MKEAALAQHKNVYHKNVKGFFCLYSVHRDMFVSLKMVKFVIDHNTVIN